MTGYPRSDSIEFAAHPAVAACARRRTRLALRAWDLEELADDAEQVVTDSSSIPWRLTGASS